MEPLTMALIAGGATALGGIPSAFAPRRTEKAQKKRLKELERMEEMGALGLTEQQRTSARQELQAPSIQAQQRADAEMRRLATANAQPGQQLQQASLAAQNRAATEAQIASSILGLDLEEQAKQQQEMKNLRGVLDERRIEKVDALTKPITEGAAAYIQADTLETLFNQLPEDRIETVSNETGTSPTKIKRTFPILNNPGIPGNADGLFPGGIGAEERFRDIAFKSALEGFEIPLQSKSIESGFRPDNILTDLGLGITQQLQLGQKGFTQEDMVKLSQFRKKYPNMTNEELLEFYLAMNAMGGQ